uniref:Cilia and flagella associated protein 161 n=1 Tax=Strix occidentalis caurina TaxID=311401 RepID=A0A8D0EL41_STROC
AAMAAYRPGVLIGNWNEDAYLEEVGEEPRPSLLSSSRGTSPIQLSVSKDGLVHFGDTVMLLNPPNKSSVENYPGACGSLTLAIDLDEISIYSAESLQVPCGVSAVKSVDPMGRNTFCILSVDGDAVGEPIRFGQNFGLGTTGGRSDQMLYLASDHKSFMRSAKKSYLQQVFLTDERSYLTCWKATFLDPQLRLEYEGFPVPSSYTLNLKSIKKTPRHLNKSMFFQMWFLTFCKYLKQVQYFRIPCNC